MFIRSNKAFSMVEVVIASMILAGTIGVVFASIGRSRVPQQESDRKLQAAIYGQRVLGQLRGMVSVDQWNAPPSAAALLSVGVHNLSAVVPVAPAGVSGTYTVTAVGGVRRVVANVVYTP